MHVYKEIDYPNAEKLNEEAKNGWKLHTIFYPKANVYPGF
jgi:hypothetical protein